MSQRFFGVWLIGSWIATLSFLATAPAGAKPVTSVMVFSLKAQRGVDPGLATVLQDILLTELQKYNAFSAVSQDDLTDLLTLERQKDVLGCNEDTCMAEIGGALGVQKILTGTVSRLGENLSVTLKLLDVASAGVDRRATDQARGEDQAALLVRRMLPRVLGQMAATAQPKTRRSGVGRLSIFTKPSGAEVFVDSQNVGTTPLTVDHLAAGEHVLTITLRDFVEITKKVDITKGQEKKVIESLVRQTGGLEISSQPPGAKVFLDNTLRGEAPQTIPDLPTGPHQLKLTLPGYHSVEQEVTVNFRAVNPVAVDLKAKPGPILFTTTPDGAEIWIDGEERGKTKQTIELDPGKYEIAFVLDGYRVPKSAIQVAPDTPQTVSQILEPGETIRPRNAPFPWHWVTGAGTVATGVTAIALGSVTLSLSRDAKSRSVGDPDVPDMVDRGETMATVTDVLWVATTALGLLTGYLFITYDETANDW